MSTTKEPYNIFYTAYDGADNRLHVFHSKSNLIEWRKTSGWYDNCFLVKQAKYKDAEYCKEMIDNEVREYDNVSVHPQ